MKKNCKKHIMGFTIIKEIDFDILHYKNDFVKVARKDKDNGKTLFMLKK